MKVFHTGLMWHASIPNYLYGVNVDGDWRTFFLIPLDFLFYFFISPNWIIKFPIMVYIIKFLIELFSFACVTL